MCVCVCVMCNDTRCATTVVRAHANDELCVMRLRSRFVRLPHDARARASVRWNRWNFCTYDTTTTAAQTTACYASLHAALNILSTLLICSLAFVWLSASRCFRFPAIRVSYERREDAVIMSTKCRWGKFIQSFQHRAQ